MNLAKENPDSPAATWALLQAATEYYNLALATCPTTATSPCRQRRRRSTSSSRSSAKPRTTRRRRASRRWARPGSSRCAATRAAKAIEQYQLVVKEWPENPGGR